MPGDAGASRARRPLSRPRRGVLLFAAFVAILVLTSLTREARAAYSAIALLPYVFPDAPVRPLDWIAPAPIHEEVRYTDGSRELVADLYRPGDGGRHAALLLSLGVHPVARDDPALVRLANGLARDAFVVLVPESPDLRADRILPSERDAFVAGFQYLAGHPAVDRARIGFVGFSAGASLLAVAAADPRINAQVRMVNFFGGYDDAVSLLRAMTSRRIILADGTVRAWEPAPLARSIFANVLLENVDDPVDRALVSRAIVDGNDLSAAERLLLGERARLIYDLFSTSDPDRVDILLAALPGDLRTHLAAVSPSTYASDLRARIYLMHDVDDSFVPFVESRRFAARLPEGQRVYTEFSLFAHVQPTRSLGALAFLDEIGKLLRHLYLVMLELA